MCTQDVKLDAERKVLCMTEVSEALEKLLAKIPKCSEYVKIDIDKAYGLVTAEDIKAPMPVPHFPKSAMDGYAVKALEVAGASYDKPVVLKVIGELCAGEYEEVNVGDNTALRVMTGSLVPEGFDAVVRQEDTDYGMENVSVFKGVKQYQNYCKVGEDISPDDVVIKKNTKINSLHIGILASLGIEKINVIRPMSVAIVSTGTELTELGKPLGNAKIYNSISHILSSKINAAGQKILSTDCCVDDVETLSALIKERISYADILITTGAVSVGKKDIIPEVMEKIGAQRIFKGLNIQPGTPTEANVYDGKVILCFSGNPYAAIANFELFYWEILSKYMDNKSFKNSVKSAILDTPYDKVNKLRRLVRGVYNDGHVSINTTVHSSSVISNMAECNCFIDFKENTPVSVGDTVKVILLRE